MLGHGLLQRQGAANVRRRNHDPTKTIPEKAAESQAAPASKAAGALGAEEQARAQGYLRGLEQALQDLGIPDTLAEVVARKLKAQGKRFGLMFPPSVWVPKLPRAEPGQGLGQEPAVQDPGGPAQAEMGEAVATVGPREAGGVVAAGGRQKPCDSQSVAVDLGGRRQRLQEGWAAPGAGGPVVERPGAAGPAWHRWPRLLIVVIGEGKLVVPVDFEVRRPDPEGPGRPCRDKLTWLEVMLDRTLTALQPPGLRLPAPLVGADSWFGDSGLLGHVETASQGTVVVEGKSSYVFHLPDGRRVKGQALL